jgi:hypothetical protein
MVALSSEERKARREAGRQRELEAMTVAKKVQRDLTTGRPPVSELRTPNAALTAAATLYRKIEMGIENETYGQRPRAGDYFAVSVGYVTPDLSVLGFTPLYAPGEGEDERTERARIEKALTGNIALGLIFGIADGEEILMGARPFLVTKQTDEWLAGLLIAVHGELESDRVERQ